MKKTVIIITASAAILLGVFVLVDKLSFGMLGFPLWKMVNGYSDNSAYVDINDVSLHFQTYGDGSPVMVLHGGLASISTMHRQITVLSEFRRVIAVDSRGHGRSEDGDPPITYALMADDVKKLMDHLHIESADIVGWSDGGNIGLHLAIHYPDRVRRLVTLGANYDAEGIDLEGEDGESINDPEAFEFLRIFYGFSAPDPAHWPVFLKKVLHMWQTEPHYTEEQLMKIKSPTLVIAGEFDVIKPAHTQRMADLIPDSK